MLPRDVQQRRVIEGALLTTAVGRNPANGRPRLRQDAVRGMEPLQGRLLKVRMDLDLVHGGHDRGRGKQTLEMVGHEIVDADRSYRSACKQRLERAIRVERLIEAARQRLMQEQQVDLVDAQLGSALVERVQRGVVPIVANPDLRLQEHPTASNA